MLTFDGYNQLWDDREDLLRATTSQQVLYSLKICQNIFTKEKNATDLNSKEDIRVLCLSESVKEEGEVVVVVQGLKGHLVVENLKK